MGVLVVVTKTVCFSILFFFLAFARTRGWPWSASAKLQQWQSALLLLIKKGTYVSVVYPKTKLKKVVKILNILDVLWCGVNAWQGENHSPPQVFALVNVLLTTCWMGCRRSPFFFVNEYWYTGNNRASVTPTGPFGVNNQETRMCGDSLGWVSTDGKESARDHS